MVKREFRILHGTELRAADGDKPGITGYAAVFNQLSEDLGGFREMILPGAFKRCLGAGADVRCLFNHDSNIVLGRTKSRTLRCVEDDHGLSFNCDLPDTEQARSLLVSIRRGDIAECSFGFIAQGENWHETKDAGGAFKVTRELTDVDLFDVSPVTYAAYPQTAVVARALWPDGEPDGVIEHRAGERQDASAELERIAEQLRALRTGLSAHLSE